MRVEEADATAAPDPPSPSRSGGSARHHSPAARLGSARPGAIPFRRTHFGREHKDEFLPRWTRTNGGQEEALRAAKREGGKKRGREHYLPAPPAGFPRTF